MVLFVCIMHLWACLWSYYFITLYDHALPWLVEKLPKKSYAITCNIILLLRSSLNLTGIPDFLTKKCVSHFCISACVTLHRIMRLTASSCIYTCKLSNFIQGFLMTACNKLIIWSQLYGKSIIQQKRKEVMGAGSSFHSLVMLSVLSRLQPPCTI